MKLPRLRFTIRGLIVAIAIVGLLFAYGERWRRYKRLATYHRGKADEGGFFHEYGYDARIMLNGKTFTIESSGHMAKSREYDYAALRPWLSVSPEVVPTDPVTSADFVPAESVEPVDASSKDGPGPSPFEIVK